MTTLQKLEKPVTITLKSGDLDILAGLLIGEWQIVRHEDRAPYAENLLRIRREIFKAQEKAGSS